MPGHQRIQIQLEPWQYQRLKARAAEEEISLSEVIGRSVERHLGKAAGTDRTRLDALRGMFSDPEAGEVDHDGILYDELQEGRAWT